MSRYIAKRCIKLLYPQSHFPIISKSSFSTSSPTNKFQNYYLRRRRKWLLSPYKTNHHHQENDMVKEAMKSLKLSPPTHLLSSLIDSFASYNCDPTPEAYFLVIKTLTLTSQLSQLHVVLDRLEKIEKFETPELIFVYLIRFYGGINRFQEAIDVFFKIPNFRCVPSVTSLDCLLSVLCKKEKGLEIVPQILLKSRLMNVRFEESSFCVLIKGLCRAKKGANAVRLLYDMVENDIRIDGKSFSLILATLCGEKGLSFLEFIGFLKEIKRMRFSLSREDWKNVIRFLVKNGKGMDAFGVLNQMKADGIKPDIVCYTMVLDGVISEGGYVKADEVFDEMLVLGLVPDILTFNVYVNGLCKQSKFRDGVKMLACMEEMGCKPDLIIYNALLRALCEHKELTLAKDILKGMRVKGVKLNSVTYKIMICGLVSKGDVIEARGLLEEMAGNCLIPHSSILDDIVCRLCQTGLFLEVFNLLKEIDCKNVVLGARSWEALIVGFGIKHSFEEAAFVDLKN